MNKTFKTIKGTTENPLKQLNEAKQLKNPNKYVFQGVFTQCSTPEHKVVNRNSRIYMETEVLRHLGYLREQIKEQGMILGELDHPEGRFDVQMKEASHKITDLWYDDKTKCVMGRLEVLDTKNGQTLKELIDAGYPLYVSSRAAGDVNEKTKEVEIAQIFTYDVVCTPGFKEAKLERLNESLSPKALKYINESISAAKNVEDCQDVDAKMINEAAIAQFNNTTVNDVNTPLNEDEENVLNDQEKYLPTLEINPLKETNNDEENKEDNKKSEEDTKETSKEDTKEDDKVETETTLTDTEKEKNREMILDIVGLDSDGEPIGASQDDKNDSQTEENKEDIIDIEAVGKNDNETKNTEDTEKTEENEDNSDNKTDESVESKATDTCEKKSKLKECTEKDIAELESILSSVSKSEAVKESIIARYPFAISLSESNFAKFASLRPKMKKRCADFIEENEIFDIQAINELWTTPLREDKRVQQNWLKLASQTDIDLYVAAPIEIQNAIEESAKYVILDTQEEVDQFWQRTGLRQAAAQKLINERTFIAKQQAINENKQFQQNNPLGYDVDFITMTERWFENND